MAFSQKFKSFLLRQYLPGWLAQGYSVTKLYNQWKGTELGFRKKEFLKVGRQVTGYMKKEKSVKEWPERKLLRRHLYIETDLRRARRYRVFARAEYYDIWEDVEVEKTISIYTDSLTSKYDWQERVMAELTEEENYQRYHIRSITMGSIEHQRGAPY